MQYHISNTTSGHDLGTFEGATSLDAYQAMMRDAGYPDGDSAESAGLSWDAIPGDVAVVEMEEADDLDLAMLTPPTRPGPCKAATAPEVDPVEKRLEREREEAPFRAEHWGFFQMPNGQWVHDLEAPGAIGCAVEVQHGSGKVKV